MDGERFDQFARSLAGRSTRRSLLKRFSVLVAAGMAAGASSSAGAEGECEEGQILCGTTCVDPLSDVYHCGECGNFCGGVPQPGYSSIGQCIAGECQAVCLPGYEECGDTCVDLGSDVYNCGACGNFCGGVPGPGYASVGECIAGECHAVCLPDADDCGGTCTDLSWDVHNCGACGNQCAGGEICCSGSCVGPNSAERYCDSCGLQAGWPQGCLANEVCTGGVCVAAGSSQGTGEDEVTGTPGPESAGDAAYQLSVLESQSDFDALYDLMHPDAQIVVPRGSVTYWYSTYFAQLGPQPLTVTGVTTADWTWDVIGRTYADTAVVSFQQPFTSGNDATDVVRLVQDSEGVWRWFFGRSAEFVETMIAEATAAGAIEGDQPLPEATGVEPALLFSESVAMLGGVDPECLTADAFIDTLPQQIQGNGRHDVPVEAGSSEVVISYVPLDADGGNFYPDLQITIRTLSATETPESMMADIEASVEDWQGPAHTSPPRALVIDIVPDSPYLISYLEEFTELRGFVPVVTFGVRGGSEFYVFAGPGIVAVNELAAIAAESILADPQCVV